MDRNDFNRLLNYWTILYGMFWKNQKPAIAKSLKQISLNDEQVSKFEALGKIYDHVILIPPRQFFTIKDSFLASAINIYNQSASLSHDLRPIGWYLFFTKLVAEPEQNTMNKNPLELLTMAKEKKQDCMNFYEYIALIWEFTIAKKILLHKKDSVPRESEPEKIVSQFHKDHFSPKLSADQNKTCTLDMKNFSFLLGSQTENNEFLAGGYDPIGDSYLFWSWPKDKNRSNYGARFGAVVELS